MLCPARRWPWSNSPCHAVRPEIGRLAPTVKSTSPGSGARLRASIATYSASVPSRCQSARPNTRCPTDTPVVPYPRALTTPASSCPGIDGVRSRSARSVQVEGHPSSVETNPDAWTSTMTSFIAAGGSGRSASVIPAVPAAWSLTTIAFIRHLLVPILPARRTRTSLVAAAFGTLLVSTLVRSPGSPQSGPASRRQSAGEREQPPEHGHDHDVEAVQDTDDQQDATEPGGHFLDLCRGHVVGQERGRLGSDGEEDVGGEDQVVDDVGEHDVALARQRVVVEDVCGVRAAEPLDERPEPDRDGPQGQIGGDLQDPPWHVQSLLVSRGQADGQGDGHGGAHRPREGDPAMVPTAGAVIGDAADHAGEQVGRGLVVVTHVAERLVETRLQVSHECPPGRRRDRGGPA